jgi:hypothetical protein
MPKRTQADESFWGSSIKHDRVQLLDQLCEFSQGDEDLSAASWESMDWVEYNSRVEEAAGESAEDAEDVDMPSGAAEALAGGGMILASISDIVANLLTVDQDPFSFIGREYLQGLYDPVHEYPDGCRNQIWLAGRQVEKSTTQAAKSIALGVMRKSYKTLYVAPRFEQVRVFSQQRFKPMCEDSPNLAPWIRPSRTLWQVSSREFVNGAFFNFRSCYLSADNARGITCHHLNVDEIQDIVSDAIPVLEECQSHATPDLRFRSYAGTPKTTSNVLSRRFENSCQFEWHTKCVACNHWNFLDERIVGDTCFVCTRCGREIDPKVGQFIPMRPSLLDKCWGFRISQLMVPFQSHADIVAKRDDPNYSRQKYFNECLGLAYDEGQLVLTEAVMREACNPEVPMQTIQQCRELADRGVPLFGGVDYGPGEGDNPSYTVLTIGWWHTSGYFQVLWMRRLVGDDSNLARQTGVINQLFSDARVRWMGADWGFGAAINKQLIHEHGWHRVSANRCLLEYQYGGQKAFATWNDAAQRYIIDRNQGMEKLIDSVRTGQLRFFRVEEMAEFIDDFTTIHVEFDEKRNTRKYDHDLPDDAFHSVNYAYMAACQHAGKLVPTFLKPLS